jgi:hypothetical protein
MIFVVLVENGLVGEEALLPMRDIELIVSTDQVIASSQTPVSRIIYKDKRTYLVASSIRDLYNQCHPVYEEEDEQDT